MTFNAESRLRSLEDRSAALGSSRCELTGMHSVPKSAVLPYASGVGGLSRRLSNLAMPYMIQELQSSLEVGFTTRSRFTKSCAMAETCRRWDLPGNMGGRCQTSVSPPLEVGPLIPTYLYIDM